MNLKITATQSSTVKYWYEKGGKTYPDRDSLAVYKTHTILLHVLHVIHNVIYLYH